MSAVVLALAAWLASPWGFGFPGFRRSAPIRALHSAPAIIGVLGLTWAWFKLRRAGFLVLRRALAYWVIPLLTCPPLLSRDGWAYLEQGWIVLQGHDPYQVGLATIGGPFATSVDIIWAGTTPVYPSLALMIQAGIVWLSGADPLWSLLAMRLPGLVSVLVIAWTARIIAAGLRVDRDRALWFAALNPLVLVHALGGMHNDAWAVALAMAGAALALRARAGWLPGCLLVGLAMAIKQPIGLVMVAVVLMGLARPSSPGGWASWREIIVPAWWRLVVGTTVVFATFGAVEWLSGWGFGWASGTGAPFTVGSLSVTYVLSWVINVLFGVSVPGAQSILFPIIMGLGLVGIAVLFWRWGASQPVAVSAWGLVIFAFAYPSLHIWYLLWGGCLLGVIAWSARTEEVLAAAVPALGVASILPEYGGLPNPTVLVITLVIAGLTWLRMRDTMDMCQISKLPVMFPRSSRPSD